jgi:hypothetical protein
MGSGPGTSTGDDTFSFPPQTAPSLQFEWATVLDLPMTAQPTEANGVLYAATWGRDYLRYRCPVRLNCVEQAAGSDANHRVEVSQIHAAPEGRRQPFDGLADRDVAQNSGLSGHSAKF